MNLLQPLTNFVDAWFYESFTKRSPDSNYVPRNIHNTAATIAPRDSYSPLNIFYNFSRQLFFGGCRIQHATVIRTNGDSVRQIMSSVGFGLGRVSMRNTLNPKTNFPNAAHLELILGFKFASVGASFGRTFEQLESIIERNSRRNISSTVSSFKSMVLSRENNNVMLTWFRRFQWSVTAPDKEVIRILINGAKASVQPLGEISSFGSSQAINEMGETLIYQFEQEHLRTAKALVQTEGMEAAITFLKRHYRHIAGDEAFISRGLHSLNRGILGLGLELFTGTIMGTALSSFVPAGHLQHAIQNSVTYVVGNLFRGGWATLNLHRTAGALLEGIPLSMTHGLISLTLNKVEEKFQFHVPLRRVVEDMGSLMIYGRLKVNILSLRNTLLPKLRPTPLFLGLGLVGGAALLYYLHSSSPKGGPSDP